MVLHLTDYQWRTLARLRERPSGVPWRTADALAREQVVRIEVTASGSARCFITDRGLRELGRRGRA